jgi:hypothetical protein
LSKAWTKTWTKSAAAVIAGVALLATPVMTSVAAAAPLVGANAQWYDQGKFPNATCEAKKQYYLARGIPARCDPIPPLPNVYEELWVFWDPG